MGKSFGNGGGSISTKKLCALLSYLTNIEGGGKETHPQKAQIRLEGTSPRKDHNSGGSNPLPHRRKNMGKTG